MQVFNHICMRMGKQVDGPKFVQFQVTLDGETKRLQSKRFGSVKNKAEVITEEEQYLLWQTGQLGDSNPQQLLDTMVFYSALEMEHCQLHHTPSRLLARIHTSCTERMSPKSSRWPAGEKHKTQSCILPH